MRLNSNVRQEIIRNATKVLLEREAKLAVEEQKLFEKCYLVAVSTQERKLVDALLAIKDGWLKTIREAGFNVAGQTIKLKAGHDYPVPQNFYTYQGTLGAAITMDKHGTLVQEVRDWQDAWTQLKTDKSRAEQTLKTLLKTVGSTETLFKAWPEGKKFYSSPPLTPQTKTGVPAVQMEALNKMIGLST